MQWVDIPGWDRYQINEKGVVRSAKIRGNAKAPKPLVLKPQPHLGNDCVRMEKGGKRYHVPIATLMADVFLGGAPDGKVIYHKDGSKHDHDMYNIGFATKQELGKRLGSEATRKPVAKIDSSGEVIEFYRSAREAARKNYCGCRYVTDRCKKRIKNEFRDGFSFRWVEDV